MTETPVVQVAEEVSTETVAFFGKEFHVADRIGLMPLLKFAKHAREGVDSADAEGLAAMYDFLRQCIADDDWNAFENHATDQRADDEDLLELITQVMEIVGERPTKRRSGSSTGSSTTAPSSEGDSSSRVIQRFEQDGRPDLALIVTDAVEQRKAG
jgi:hypothetical protein